MKNVFSHTLQRFLIQNQKLCSSFWCSEKQFNLINSLQIIMNCLIAICLRHWRVNWNCKAFVYKTVCNNPSRGGLCSAYWDTLNTLLVSNASEWRHSKTRSPRALTVTWVSETLYWLLVRSYVCISKDPS